MPDLSELIQAQLDRGESLRGLARKTGDRVDHQTIDRWHKRAVTQFPRDQDVFDAFADVLHVNVDQVVLSMALQLGVPVRRTASVAAFLPPGTERLTGAQRDALRALIRSILAPGTAEGTVSGESGDQRPLRMAAQKRPKSAPSGKDNDRHRKR